MSWNVVDPSADYVAARNGVVIIDRSDRAVLRVHGRDPLRMVHNLVTNDVAGIGVYDAVYAALLTPKGRMVADLRVIRRETDLLLECDALARASLLDTWKRSVPPLFARIEDLSTNDANTGLAVLGVYGPRSASLLSAVLDEPVPHEANEMQLFRRRLHDNELFLLRTHDNAARGYDVILPAAAAASLSAALIDAGAASIGMATLDTLRIEAGRPKWGAELDADVIPLEAGLLERAISTTKGCYTGQEVIIRILHRGHVNWHLRGLLMGGVSPPERGVTLHRAGEAKTVGRITSAAASPALDQTIALGYVRREIEPRATLRLGSPEGPEIEVVSLPFEPAS